MCLVSGLSRSSKETKKATGMTIQKIWSRSEITCGPAGDCKDFSSYSEKAAKSYLRILDIELI